MIFRIDDVHPAPAVNNQGPRFVESSWQSSAATPTTQRGSVQGKLLNAAVATLDNIRFPMLSKCQIRWIRELPPFFTGLTPAADEFTLTGENLNPMVGGVHNVKVAIGAEG